MTELLLDRSVEQNPPSPEAIETAVQVLASEFHEDWRKTRQQEDGTYEPRVKSTVDDVWAEAHGTSQVDIANTPYTELPEDWQAENKAAAAVIVDVLSAHDGKVDLSDEATRIEVGAAIHNAWLARNEWAKGGELDVPFEQLSPEEQAKDIAQVEVAQRVFE